ncbi:MAG: MlaD family protein [Desulfovermiculus sp.]|nr:MlaD family protein [Desulfovermiculus sp.]
MPVYRTQTVIGLFVLGALVLAVAAVTVLGSGRLFSQTTRFALYFQDSVSGLSIGAPVLFRGVKVGQVTDIRLIADAKDMQVHIPVIVEIKPFEYHGQDSSQNLEQTMQALIARGLRGQLAMQSMVTGQYQILLDFHPQTKAQSSDMQTDYPEIPTIPSSLQELTSQMSDLPLKEMTGQLSQVLTGINRLVNHEDMDQSLSLVRQTLQGTSELTSQLNKHIPEILTSIRQTSDTSRETIQGIGADMTRLTANLDRTAVQAQETLQTTNKQLGPMLAALEQTFTTAGSTLEQTRSSLSQLSNLIGRDSGLHQELERTLKDIQNAARAVQNLSDYLERNPEALIRGKGGY